MATTTIKQPVTIPAPEDLENIYARIEGKTVIIELGGIGGHGDTLSISFDWDGEDCYHNDVRIDEDDNFYCEDCDEVFDSPEDADIFDARAPRFYVHVEHWGCNLSHHRKD